MHRINQVFRQQQEQNKPVLIPFITAGYPTQETTVDILHELVASGADLIELGMPFSDPMADGIEIQQANEVALKNHTNLNKVLEYVANFRTTNQHTPIVLMGYANPIYAYGNQRFIQTAAQIGVDGLLVVDLPYDNQEGLTSLCDQHQLALINLIAPTTNSKRCQQIMQASQAFVYYVALKGITGSSHLDVQSVHEKIEQLRKFSKLPIAVGFGIANPVQAKQIAEFADAVVIGSEIIRKLRSAKNESQAQALQRLSNFMQQIRLAIDH